MANYIQREDYLNKLIARRDNDRGYRGLAPVPQQ